VGGLDRQIPVRLSLLLLKVQSVLSGPKLGAVRVDWDRAAAGQPAL